MLTLDSDPGNIASIEAFVQKITEKYRLSPDTHGNILISLTEAVNNAIIHGNCEDRSKCVKIRFDKIEDRISFRVSDEGCGFDFQSLPDPTRPENRCKLGGRGVFLIQQLSDQVHFHDNGSTVEMHFKL
ncbi:MAG: ATP-binding protein [Saprospiraceae bacterium]|nr:ATP-binding protein [Saprospiraceae bacterium]